MERSTRHITHTLPLALLGVVAAGACSGRSVSLWGDGASLTDAAAPAGDGPAVSPDASTTPRTIKWITVKPGTFRMGSPVTEACRLDNETRHAVTLSHGFQIAQTEITQHQFALVMGENPSRPNHISACGQDCPVDSIGWSDAVVFCNYMSEKANLTKCYTCVGKGTYDKPYDCRARLEYEGAKIYDCPGYRLPTEAEWEYAYRAGSSAPLHNGKSLGHCFDDPAADPIAWYAETAGGRTRPVARKQPNAWGLYDMAGNVWEWVQDWYSADLGTGKVTDPSGPGNGSGKVLRGGSWVGGSGTLRAAQRNTRKGVRPQSTVGFLGFRPVRTTNPK